MRSLASVLCLVAAPIALGSLTACSSAGDLADAGAAADGAAGSDAHGSDASRGDAEPDAERGLDATDGARDDAAAGDVLAAPDLDATTDGGPSADATVAEPVDPDRSLHLLFIGNSFTLGGPVPTLVDLLANEAGWPDPEVAYSAFGGETLQGHRARPETLALVDRGGWDVVVLQELSTRPTDALGDPQRFKDDATWFHDRVHASSPSARVVLYETWAREAAHPYYPVSFRDPAEMQAQLRTHYRDAAFTWIPAHAAAPALPSPELAPVGDAWERHLLQPAPLRLHAADDYHAAETGQYLNALVLYGTIYRRAVLGRTPWQLPLTAARRLQEDADATTGWTLQGGPPRPSVPLGLTPGQRVQLDLGDTSAGAPGWNDLDDPTAGFRVDLRTADDAPSTVDAYVTVDFGGVNGVGSATNGLGYPSGASQDSFFAGSFADHADGLDHPGQLTVRGLDPAGLYRVELFASRSTDDGGLGRLTRYEVTGAAALGWQDLEVADNTSRLVRFEHARPSGAGELIVDVAVSPVGTARFAYLGVLVLTRE